MEKNQRIEISSNGLNTKEVRYPFSKIFIFPLFIYEGRKDFFNFTVISS
jgi:hypothetical protein